MCSLSIQTILDDVQIEVGHIYDTEVVYAMIDVMELEAVIGFPGYLDQIIHLSQSPAVYFHQILIGYAVGIGIEVEEVAEDIPGSVADLRGILPRAA